MEAKSLKPVVDKRSRYVKKTFDICPTAYPYFTPEKAKPGSIGYDLVCPVDFRVPAHSRVAIPVNFAINLPFGVEAKIEARSGMTLRGMEGYGRRVKWVRKWGFIPWKTTQSGKMNFDADVMPGKIDPNFTDSINVILKNNDVAFTIKAGTRIAQMTFYSTIAPFFEVVSKLSCKSRGGGLGSSGTTAKSDAVKQVETRQRLYVGGANDGLDRYNHYVRRQREKGQIALPLEDWLKQQASFRKEQPRKSEVDVDKDDKQTSDKE